MIPSSRQVAARHFFPVASPQRIFALQRSDRMDFGCTAKRVWTGFREAEPADFAGFDEFSEGANGVLDRNVGINAMLVVEIDDVDAETLEAAVTGATNVGWGAVHAAAGTVGIDAEAELGGDYDTIARAAARNFPTSSSFLNGP